MAEIPIDTPGRDVDRREHSHPTVTYTMVLGIILLAIGLLGALTGGHDHELIIFGINATHNVVHLASGAAAILCAMIGLGASRAFCLLFGIVYGLVMLAGFLGVEPIVRMLNLNMADNFLHRAIAASALDCAFAYRATPATARAPATAPERARY